MKCPVTSHTVVSDPDDECTEYTMMTACESCPAYTKRLPLQRWLVHIILPLLVGMMMFGSVVMPASAHDPTHDTIPMVKKAITGGKAGGLLRLTKDGKFGTWTDGWKHVAILKDGKVVTFYCSRNCAEVAAKVAAQAGAKQIGLSKGAKILKAVKKVAGTEIEIASVYLQVIAYCSSGIGRCGPNTQQ